jgi:hypothetical protein
MMAWTVTLNATATQIESDRSVCPDLIILKLECISSRFVLASGNVFLAKFVELKSS